MLCHCNNGLNCTLCWSFATLDVRKLVVCQVEADDGHSFLDAPLVFLQHFEIYIGRWSLLGSIYNVPKVHESQNHLHFELSMILAASLSKYVIFRSKNGFVYSKNLIGSSSPQRNLRMLRSIKIVLLHLNVSYTFKYLKSVLLHLKKNILRHLNHSNNICFTSNVPYILKYFKLDPLHLKRSLKTFKSLKQDLLFLKCLALSLKRVFQCSNHSKYSSMLLLSSND